MTLRIQAVDAQVWTITAHGRIDLPAARAIEDAITELCDAGRSRIVVDLSEVVYMASAGLAATLRERVPLHFTGKAVGVALGGILQPVQREVEVLGRREPTIVTDADRSQSARASRRPHP